MNLIEIDNIDVAIGKQKILNQVSLKISPNEIVGLIGPSGAGKTTLIKAIMGMMEYSSGKVKLFENPKYTLNTYNKIGYMAQNDSFYESLSGKENLEFFGSLYGMSKSRIKDRIDYLQNIIKLDEDIDKKSKNYSGGMKRRLSFGISLIHDPTLLILDEPTVGLDPKLKINVWNELAKLKKDKTILVTTHIMEEALKCDRLVLISQGKIIADGSSSQLMEKYNVSNIEDIFINIGK